MSSARTRIQAEDRLFSLVLALLATEHGLTKAEILGSVHGYRQRVEETGATASLERQFERDKDDIRELGVPLETLEDPGDPGNNQALRYRIPRQAYDLPSDVRFSPQELALLNLAAKVWQEGSLSGEARRALFKLGAHSVADEPLIGYAPRVRVREAAFAPLDEAIRRQVVVAFPYLKPGEASPRERTVAPLALVQHEGEWLVHAHELSSGIAKNFLLRRIAGPVAVTARRHPRPPGDQERIALDGLEAFWQAHSAQVRVEPGSDAESRLSRRRGTTGSGGLLQLHYSDLALIADELAAHGPEVVVLAPAELRDAVRSRLERTAGDHG